MAGEPPIPATAAISSKSRLTNDQVLELSKKMNMILAKAKSVINSTHVVPQPLSMMDGAEKKRNESSHAALAIPFIDPQISRDLTEKSVPSEELSKPQAQPSAAVGATSAAATPSKKPLFDKTSLNALKEKLRPSSQVSDVRSIKTSQTLLFDSLVVECKVLFDTKQNSFCSFQSLHPQVLEYAVLFELIQSFLGVGRGEIIDMQEIGGTCKFSIAAGISHSFHQQISSILSFSCVIKTLRNCVASVRQNLTVFGRIVGDFFRSVDSVISEFCSKLADFEKVFWDGTKSLLSLCALIDRFKGLLNLFVHMSQTVLNQFSITRQNTIVSNHGNPLSEAYANEKFIAGGNLINFIYETSLRHRGDSAVYAGLVAALESCISCYNGIVLEAITTGFWADKSGLDYLIVKKRNYNPITDEEMSDLTIDKNNIPYHLIEYSEKLLKISKFHQIIQKNKASSKDTHLQTRHVFSEEILQKNKFDKHSITESIQSVFVLTNEKMYRFLVDKMMLPSHLRLFVDFFLMQNSRFFQCFFDAIRPYSSAKIADVSLGKISAAFESSLESNLAEKNLQVFFNSSFYVSQLMEIINLSCDNTISPFPHFKELDLKVIDSVTIDYLAEYPLNMIFTPKIITKYQLLFRHLLHVYSLEKKLSRVSDRTRKIDPKFCFVRQKMVSFLHSIRYYFLIEVVEPNWKAFEKSVIIDEKYSSLEDFIKAHEDYLDNLLKESLLTDHKLLKLYSNIVLEINAAICTCFEATNAQKISPPPQTAMDNFMINLKVFIDALYFNSATDADRHLANLLCRIDFNDFYSNYFCLKEGGDSAQQPTSNK